MQTHEAATPMDTEAEMKQVRAELNDEPEKKATEEGPAKDAPLVSACQIVILVAEITALFSLLAS